jgi:hypothetical protein
MMKKIIAGVLLLGVSGALIAGGIIRANAVAGQASEGGSGGQNHGGAESETDAGNGQGGQSRGRQGGGGSAAGSAGLADPQPAAGWLAYTGLALSVDEGALLIDASGEEVPVEGRAWRYALEQGFRVEQGDEAAITGYWEAGEFKACQAENLTTGQVVEMRDAEGHPLWSGGRRGG